jgi:pimeloyl-ACP methyl ester carboxylesterase
MLVKLLVALVLVVAVLGLGLVALVYLQPARLYKAFIKLMRRRAGLVRKELTLSDGLRFAYLDGGSGEPLLLLHGFGGDKDNFVAIAPYLRHRYRLIIPDILGFGESSKPPAADYSAEAQVDRLSALVRAVGITQRVHVGGNSMGGLLTLYFGARHPTQTASLWLLDPAAMFGGPLSEPMRIAVQEKRNPFDIRSPEDLAELLKKAFAKPPWIPRPILVAQMRDFIANQAVQDRVFIDTMKAEVEKHISGMKIPTLIVWGEQDHFVHPAGAEILHGLLPNSNVVMMPNVGHMPQMEVPRQTAADFLTFQRERGHATA